MGDGDGSRSVVLAEPLPAGWETPLGVTLRSGGARTRGPAGSVALLGKATAMRNSSGR